MGRLIRRIVLTAGPLWLALALSAAQAQAQDYPNRPIRIVVGFPAGGGVDTVARVVGNELSKALGPPVVIDNKPGAAGTLGAAEVARSTPDGYTLLVTPGGHAIFGAMFKSLPFDTVEGFGWISNVINVPFFVVVPAASEFRSLADLVAKARNNPGAVAFGSAGPGSTHHLGVELLAGMTGIKLLHVPYRGDAPLVTALIAGEVQFGLATPTLIVDNIKGGKLRALATTAGARWSTLPDVPTVEQALGLNGYDVRTWFALAGPAGLSQPIVERLNGQLRKATATSEVRERLAGVGGETAPTTPAEMRERVVRELAVWTKTVDAAGIPKQ
jgi:tripartite-type tricarboxylate transporter receptor subunit TctC